jgi:uncharacterized protein YdbL (DUF1318 family)
MKTIYQKILAALALLTLSFSAAALDLSQAKAQGLVGEMPNGYLALVKQDSAAQKLIRTVNSKRKANYQVLAKKNGISLQQVEALAGEKAIARTARGHYVFVNGTWKKK